MEAINLSVFIGILTLDTSPLLHEFIEHDQFSMLRPIDATSDLKSKLLNSTQIDNNYIDFLGLNPLKAVPVLLDLSDEQTIDVMRRLDGILLTGGSQSLLDSYSSKEGVPTRYLHRVDLILNTAKAFNDEGRQFVVFATCLGAEAALISESGLKNVLSLAKNQIKDYKPITLLKDDGSFSRLKGYFGPFFSAFAEPVNYFNHKWGVTLDDFSQNENLSKAILPLAFVDTSDGVSFVSLAEYRHYPFYLTMFHSEKPFPIKNHLMEDLRKRLKSQLSGFIYSQAKKEQRLADPPVTEEPIAVLKFKGGIGARHFYVKHHSN